MELPIELRNIIENEIDKTSIKELQKNAEIISLKYRAEENKKGKRLITERIEALSYAAVRMPATYGAVRTALQKTFELYDGKITSLIDVGAGTGAGTWAANELIELDEIICLEREDSMRELGEYFMTESSILKNVIWKEFDLLNSEIDKKADLVICSYVLNELNDKDRKLALEKLWEATNKVLLIIEPGTPLGFKEIKELRRKLLNYGGGIIAPCPNIESCPIAENDWCHSTCRIARSKVHKILKNGDVPYEDEKFSYISVYKSEEGVNKNGYARVLRHPIIESGKITLQLCTENGILTKIVTKKDKELFKIARKINCGDLIKIN